MIKGIRSFLGVTADLLKWPMAACSAALLIPLTIFIFKYFISGHVLHPDRFTSFLIGFGIVSFIQLSFKTYTSSFLKILEHEVTHGIFAVTFLNRIVGFDFDKDTSAGSIILKGRLNWIVIIAPYFFPLLTALFILFLFIYFKIFGHVPGFTFIGLGVTTAFHFWTTLFEVHKHQTDLQRVGFFFSALFIPGANVLMYAFILVFIDRGIAGLREFIPLFKAVLRY